MTMNVLLFPWLGHAHICPFLELGKKLYNRNVNIYFCSTPINLYTVKKMLENDCDSFFIHQLIELPLPSLPELPPAPHLHTATDLPLHLMPTLKQAFDMASPQFSRILKTLNPNLLIYDMLQPWAPVKASALGIPSVAFITTSASSAILYLQLTSSSNASKLSDTIYYRSYEYEKVSKILDQSSETNRKDRDRIMGCIRNSSSIVLVKSFKEIEGKCIDSLSVMTRKKIVPVGPLISCPASYLDMKFNNVIEWLNTKGTRSTVFVSFGSDSPSSPDLEEIAYGLEKSNVNFVWISRRPNFKESFPKNVVVKDKGLLVEGWFPPTTILRHKSIGGFVSNCAWSSVTEAMKHGVPIIAMPMQLDQPINARIVVEVGVGLEVVRDGNGLLSRGKVAATVQDVVVSSTLGKLVREKAKKLSVGLRGREEEDIDVVVEELLHLCKSRGSRSFHGSYYGVEKQKQEQELANHHDSIDERAERLIKRFYDQGRLRNI